MTFVYVLSIISATVLGALLGAAVSGLAVLLYLTLRRLRVSETTKQVRSHCHLKRVFFNVLKTTEINGQFNHFLLTTRYLGTTYVRCIR